MKPIVNLMLKKYCIDKLGHDFMGYSLNQGDIYTFHHLIVPTRSGGEITEENGVILCGLTSHPYLHIVEKYDIDLFREITHEMLEMKKKECIDPIKLNVIDQILDDFEERFEDVFTPKNLHLIKPEFKERVQKKVGQEKIIG